MDKSLMQSSLPAVTDVYTNLHGLQNLKTEQNNDVALKKVAQQFESMFINMLLKNMRAANAAFSEGNMFDSNESKFYRDMHDNQLALSLAHGRGFGVADAMFRQLTQRHGDSERNVRPEADAISALAATLQAETGQSMTSSDKPNGKILNQFFTSQEDSSSFPLTQVSRRTKQPYHNSQVRDLLNTLAESRLSKVAPSIDAHLQDATVDESVINTQTENLRAQVASNPSAFIQRVTKAATVAAKALGVDKEILIAQAALETGWGQHVFADKNGKSTFNMFNIKADSRWQGDTIDRSSLEYLGGQLRNTASRFRAYDSIEASFKDYTAFILNNKRYQDAHNNAENSLDYIAKIHQAGYATDPHYSDKIAAVYGRVKTALDSPLAEERSADEQ